MKTLVGLITIAALGAAAPVAAQSIGSGQSLSGELSASDSTLEDGSYFDCYRLRARAGDRVTVTLRSDDFDAYLTVVEGDCRSDDVAASDDDGAGGTDSRVRTTLGTGAYSIRANSLGEGETGRYVLTLETAAPLPPAAPGIRLPEGEEPLVGHLTAGDRIADDDSFFDCYTFDARAGERVAIGLLSEDFDAYLSLYARNTCEGAVLDSDDDSLDEDATDALIRFEALSTGAYSVRANSLGSGESGEYAIVLVRDPTSGDQADGSSPPAKLR